jgi:hypothetical protein
MTRYGSTEWRCRSRRQPHRTVLVPREGARPSDLGYPQGHGPLGNAGLSHSLMRVVYLVRCQTGAEERVGCADRRCREEP